MLYTDFTIWLQNAINSLQEPAKSIVIVLLCIGSPLLLIGLIWISNKIENRE